MSSKKRRNSDKKRAESFVALAKELNVDPVQLLRGYEQLNKCPPPCLLCGGKPFRVAMWHPDKESQRKKGTPINKVRGFGYSLCERCAKRPDASDLVEQSFLATPNIGTTDFGILPPIHQHEIN